jgi:S-adenosylmethionine synthetase
LVNGRAASSCAGELIPVEEIAESTVRAFFAERLPELGGYLDVQLNITGNASPGAVHTAGSSPERVLWFSPRTVKDLRERQIRLSNDTSMGTGWAPENPFETFVRELVDHFAMPGGFQRDHPWCGSDVKVMGYSGTDDVDIVACVPQKCVLVGSRAEYLVNKNVVAAEGSRLMQAAFPGAQVRFRVNMRDLPDRDELYLTHTGSSIESGDEGVVGRGNRVSGLITPMRPMNAEGASGKNPVYHVGKLYNLAAQRLAQRVFEETGEYAEVHMVSATGQRLDRPWRVLVRTAANADTEKIHTLVHESLGSFTALTDEIVSAGVSLA